MVETFTDVMNFTVNGFKFYMSCLTMAWLCHNMLG